MTTSSHDGPLRILMLEDQASDAALAAAELRRADVRADFEVVSQKQAFVDALLTGPDVIIADYAVPGFGGPDALKLVRARGDDIPFIIFSGTIGEDRAVEMIKAGATDYVLKDRAIRLPQAIRQALENRRLRQQQIAAEKALRATIESALDCIVTIDEHGTVLEFNPAAEKTFGWSRAEALDHPLVYMIIPARDRESYLGALKSFLETGEPAVTGGRHEIRAVRRDGTEFPMEIAVSRSGSGRPALFTVFMRDISERFAAEEKLRAQEEQYRVLFESSPNAMWVYDLKGLRILAVNHAAEVQYGYTREEFLRLTLLELRPRGDREKVTGAISAEGAAARYAGTWTHLAKGGRALLVDVYSSPTTYEGIPARMAVLVDVTEQKGAENALRQSELSLANAQRIAQLGNWDWNLETGELRWSQQVFEVFGIARDEFDHSYDSFLRHVHADDRTNVDSAVQAAITGDAVYDLDHRILRRDGSVRTVHENGEITRDATGRAIRMAGTVQDITDRKVADQAFYESQEKYRNIVETANEGIWVLDAEGLTTYANQQLTTMLGYSAEEMRGRPIFDFVFHDSIARAGDDLAQRQAGFSDRSEYRLRRKDGTEVVALCSSSPIRDAAGKVTALLAMISDVTERKRSEEALRASEARFASAFEYAPMGMAIASLEGQWLKVNQALCDLLGYSVTELTGKYFYEVAHPESREADIEMKRRLLAGEVPFHHTEKRYLHEQGNCVWVSLGVSLVRDDEGQPLHFIAQIQDITSRKNAEAAAEKSDAEQRLLAAQLHDEKERLVSAQAVAKIGSWETNLLNQSVLWSAETFRIFGLEPGDGDNTTERFSRCIHPDDRAAVDAAFAASLQTRTPSAIEHRIVMPDGRIKCVEERWQIESDDDGTALRSSGTCQDITERKDAEHAAARTLQRLSDAQRIGQIGDWEWDVATQAIAWSPQVFAIFGRDPSVGPPQNYEEYAAYYDATNAAILAASVTRAMESGEGQEHEVVMVRPDGQRIHLHALVVPRKDETGRVIGMSGTVQDITARKRTEAAASRLLSVLEVSLNEIYIFDAETLRFEYVNECALRNLGRSMEAMRAQTPLDLNPEFTLERFYELIAPLRRQENPKVVFETAHRRVDGSLYPVEVHLQLVQRGENDVFLAVINDITARTRAAEALRQKDNLIRIAGRMTETGGWALEISDQRVFWSDEVCNILGYPHDAKPALAEGLALYPRPWREVVTAGVGACATDGTPFDAEVEVLTAQGRRLWVRVCCEAERDETGAITRVQGAFQDISRRRRADAALSDAHRKYRSIFENAAEGIFQITLGGAFISANPALARMTGYDSPEDLIRDRQDVGQQSYCDPAKWQEFKRLIGETGFVTNFEYDVKRRDGSIFSVSENTRLVGDTFSNGFYYEGSVQDITERKRSEAARDRLVQILDATTDLVSIADLGGRLQYLNPAGRKLLGVSQADDIAAKAINDFLPEPETHPIIRKAVPAAIRDGSWSGETVLRGDQGSEVHVSQVVLSHRNSAGEVEVVSTIARDITERKRAEHELEELNKQLLETSRQAGMAEVATSVLHNVGNVLNSVNVSCSIIAEKVRTSRIGTVSKTAELLQHHAGDLTAFFVSDPAGQKLPAFLTKLSERLAYEQNAILSEVHSLSHNIAHIKEIVAVQQSYAKVRGLRETLPIAGLIEDALRINAESLTRHNVEIVQEFSQIGPTSIDKHKVLQILVNLVRNAKHALVDSGRDDKRLVMRVAPCDNKRFVVSVSDNGVGIEPQNITRVFAHGFTTKKNGHGFGLHSGVLAAQEMGGSLTVQSDGVGRGATFNLELPLDGDATG